MKLIAVTDRGEHVNIELRPPCEIAEGPSHNMLIDGHRVAHIFTKDGHYDRRAQVHLHTERHRYSSNVTYSTGFGWIEET